MSALIRTFILITCSFSLLNTVQAASSQLSDTSEEAVLANVRRSIVKINAVRQDIDFRNPWLFSPSQAVSGSGFYVGANRFITNAHVVSNARFITVQKDGDSRQVSAFVEFIAHDADLAVISIANKAFFTGLKALTFGDIPKLRSPVSTVGYPAGGEQLAVTKGIVSRIDYSLYVHTDYHYHLLIQVDSAINPGASGGPVLQKGKVVGVAFQAFRAGENIGYIIPVPIIKRFLKDIASGHYRGHPDAGFVGRPWLTDNEATASFHGIHEGLKITEVTQWSPYKESIQDGDILLEIDGHAIGSDGDISFYGERVSYNVVLDLKQIDEDFTLKVKRGDAILDLKLKAQIAPEHPFNGLSYRKHPRYLVFGGLVFTELSQNYLETWGDEWPRKIPIFLRYIFNHSDEDKTFAPFRSFVVLARRLPHEINMYAEGFQNAVVKAVNGKNVLSFEEFQTQLRSLPKDFLRISFFDRDETLILPTAGLEETHKEINKSYGIEPEFWSDSKTDGAVTRNEDSE